MQNPRPPYRYLLLQSPAEGGIYSVLPRGVLSASANSIQTSAPSRLVLAKGAGSPTAKTLWRAGKRRFALVEFHPPAYTAVKSIREIKNGLLLKWEGPDLRATGNEIAIETLEIAHEGLS